MIIGMRDARAWQRLLVMAGVLFLSLYIALNVPQNIAPLLLFLFAGLFGFLILLRQPELGLVGIVVGALSIPFVVGTGTQTSLNAAVLLIPVLLGVWVLNMVRQQNVTLVPSQINLPLVFFIGCATISLIAGNLPWNYFAGRASLQAQLGGWAIFVFSVCATLLVANLVRDVRWLKLLVGIFLIVGGVYIVGKLIPLVAFVTDLVIAPGANGSLFWIWLVALAGGQAFFNRSLTKPVRLGLLALALATLGAGWLGRTWVSGWLPPLVAISVLLGLRSWRLGLASIMIGGLVVLVLDPTILSTLVGSKQYSIDTRFDAAEILLTQVFPLSPIVGLGPANYYFYTPLFPISGYYVNFNSHNQYIDILAQLGVVGFVVFAWLMVSFASLGWDLRKRVTDDFSRGYVYGCLAGLAGTMVAGLQGDWFLPFVYNIGFTGFRASILGWLFLGGLVAIEQMVRHQSQVSVE